MKWYEQLHWRIIIGLTAGLLWGLFASAAGLSDFTMDYIGPFGTLFVNLLKLIAIPLVIASLVTGVTGLNDMRKLSRMGGKTLVFYLVTTVFAITIGLVTVNIVQPGTILPESIRSGLMESYGENVGESDQAVQVLTERGPLQFLVDIVPENAFTAASDNSNMLQVVFLALLLGIGLMNIPRQNAQLLIDFFGVVNDVIIKLVDFIMKTAPVGVFALMAAVIADLAGDDLSQAVYLLHALGWYSLTVVLALILHVTIVYSGLLKYFSRITFRSFFRGIRPAVLLGFSTSSSAATLPVTMEKVEKNLGVNEEVSSFVLPVGATINMDGTSIYQAVAAVFIAQALGMDLSLVQQLSIILTAGLASIGTAGIPGAGIIMLVIVLQSIQVPVEGIALILGMDRILDMLRTAVNIMGDAAVSVAVASSEGLFTGLQDDAGR